MELIELKADIRTTRGNGPARALRREGNIPAVLYGPGAEPLSITVGTADLENAIRNRKGSQVFLNLSIGGETNRSVMLKELQKHPVSGEFRHADFYEIAKDRKLRVKVPVVTTGKAIGVEMGGMLQIIRRELELTCYPDDIPENIELDITELDRGDAIHINDVSVEGVEFLADVNFTVLTILGRKSEEEEIVGDEEEGEETEAAEAEE